MLDETTPSSASLALFGGLLVLGGSLGIPLALKLGRWLVPAAESAPPRWGLPQVVGVLLGAVAASVALALLRPLFLEGEPGLLEGLLQTLLVFLVAGGLIFVYATIPGPGGIVALGFSPSGNGRAVGMGAVVYLLLLPLLLGLAFLWPRVIELLGGEPEPQTVLVGFFELEGATLAVALVLGTLVVPFFEELIFRGFVQPVLVRWLRPAGGVVVTSALFAILHGVDAFLPVFGLSLILGAVMLRTRRLTAAWAVHGLHNALTLSLVLLYPGARELVEGAGLLSFYLS